MLVDLQGSIFKLYDPEIRTAEMTTDKPDENYFCAGNLFQVDEFFQQHNCNEYCRELDGYSSR